MEKKKKRWFRGSGSMRSNSDNGGDSVGAMSNNDGSVSGRGSS